MSEQITDAELLDARTVCREFAEGLTAIAEPIGRLAREGAAEVRELAALLAADPHAQAMVAARIREDARATDRAVQRRMLGGCPCGRAPGEDVCPVCDLGVPESLVAEPPHVAKMREVVEALTREMKAETAAPRVSNRFERRRAASRRWKR